LLLQASYILPASRVVGETFIYMANAWSFDGIGLFDHDNRENSRLALDAAMASSILPYVSPLLTTSSAETRRSFHAFLSGFPRSLAVASPWL